LLEKGYYNYLDEKAQVEKFRSADEA